jgi:hypothetical protein
LSAVRIRLELITARFPCSVNRISLLAPENSLFRPK